MFEHPALFQPGSDQKIECNGQCHTQAVDTLKRAGKQHQYDSAIHRVAHITVDTADHKRIDIVSRPPKPQKSHGIDRSEGGEDDDRTGDLQHNQHVEQHTLCTKQL